MKERSEHENRVRGQIAGAARWGNSSDLERARAELRAIKAQKLFDEATSLLDQNNGQAS